MPRPRLILNHPDPRTRLAVDIMMKDATRTVPQAMRAAGFSVEESLDRAKQMWIRRRIPREKSMKSGESKHPPTTIPTVKSSTSKSPLNASTARVAPSLQQQPIIECVGNCNTEENQSKCKCTLLEWISISRDIFVAGQLAAKSRMRKNYLYVCLQILHSLAEKMVIGCSGSGDYSRLDCVGGDANVKHLVNPFFVCVENIMLCKSTTLTSPDSCANIYGCFIRCVDLPCFQNVTINQTQKITEAAMFAFARMAYKMFMMGIGPGFPENSSCDMTTSSENALISKYSMNEDECCGDFITAMCNAGIPLPLRRFIYALMGKEYKIFDTRHSFSSFMDVHSDLKQMLANADSCLHGLSH